MDRGTISVNFTNGVGNNLFQYVFGKLLADRQGFDFVHNALPFMNIKNSKCSLNPKKRTKIYKFKHNDDTEYLSYFHKNMKPINHIFNGYFEDYLIYKPHLDKIKSWFVPIKKKNMVDLVIHLRLGDRLFSMGNYMPGQSVDADGFIEAISCFEFKRLHIVTDLKIWENVTEEQVSKMKFHNEFTKTRKLIQMATNRINSLVETTKPFNPIVRFNNSAASDFNYMRSFDKMLFQHSTLAWWAAALSCASQVGVYGPWRPNKGTSNKNLGQTDFKGWFQWGI